MKKRTSHPCMCAIFYLSLLTNRAPNEDPFKSDSSISSDSGENPVIDEFFDDY